MRVIVYWPLPSFFVFLLNASKCFARCAINRYFRFPLISKSE